MDRLLGRWRRCVDPRCPDWTARALLVSQASGLDGSVVVESRWALAGRPHSEHVPDRRCRRPFLGVAWGVRWRNGMAATTAVESTLTDGNLLDPPGSLSERAIRGG